MSIELMPNCHYKTMNIRAKWMVDYKFVLQFMVKIRENLYLKNEQKPDSNLYTSPSDE